MCIRKICVAWPHVTLVLYPEYRQILKLNISDFGWKKLVLRDFYWDGVSKKMNNIKKLHKAWRDVTLWITPGKKGQTTFYPFKMYLQAEEMNTGYSPESHKHTSHSSGIRTLLCENAFTVARSLIRSCPPDLQLGYMIMTSMMCNWIWDFSLEGGFGTSDTRSALRLCPRAFSFRTVSSPAWITA